MTVVLAGAFQPLVPKFLKTLYISPIFPLLLASSQSLIFSSHHSLSHNLSLVFSMLRALLTPLRASSVSLISLISLSPPLFLNLTLYSCLLTISFLISTHLFTSLRINSISPSLPMVHGFIIFPSLLPHTSSAVSTNNFLILSHSMSSDSPFPHSTSSNFSLVLTLNSSLFPSSPSTSHLMLGARSLLPPTCLHLFPFCLITIFFGL